MNKNREKRNASKNKEISVQINESKIEQKNCNNNE